MIKLVKEYFVTAVCVLVAFLFVYAAMSKVLDFENFQVQLAQSPLLSAYAHYISFAVVIIELTLAFYLCLPNCQKIALYCSLGLMSAFTIYIFLILNYSDFVPCSCGGILEKLGWTEHFIFNIAFVLLISAAILYKEKKDNPQNKLGLLFSLQLFCITLCCGAVVAMFVRSEHIMKKENNFTRRFLVHPVIEDRKVLDLGSPDYYFAGYDDSHIYIGNRIKPQTLITVDTALNNQSQIKITPDNLNYPFSNLRVQVVGPYYYFYDGTIPIIYRGRLGNPYAEILSFQDAYFNQLIVVDSNKFAMRTQSSDTKHFTLAALDLNADPKLTMRPNILEKQIDGVFDVDGMLIMDHAQKKLIYPYLYRNEYIVMDENLNIKWKLKTIDTTTTAQIQITKLADGRHKMKAPPLKVNRQSVAFRGILYNQSDLMGKLESREAWREAKVIDMYRTDRQEYIGSFYIYDKNGRKMRDFLMTEQYFYVMMGDKVHRYHVRDIIKKHYIKGDAENLAKSRQKL